MQVSKEDPDFAKRNNSNKNNIQVVSVVTTKHYEIAS